jgi:hypothetical protein
MNTHEIQTLLTARFGDDYSRISRMAHFMGLLKTGLDGMASLGIVLRLEGENLDPVEGLVSLPMSDVMGSLDSAIAHMQKATK